MTRSVWKFPVVYLSKNAVIKQRSATITSKYFRTNVEIHSGSSRRRIFVDRKKLGFKFGEFCFTKKHTKKIVVKKKLIKK